MDSVIELETRHKFLLGKTHQEAGRYGDAIRCYRAVIARAPRFAEAHQNLGVSLHLSGRIEAAVSAYRAVLTLQPNDVAAYAGLGLAYWKLGDLARAESHLGRALALAPRIAKNHYFYGGLMWDQRRYAEADQAFDRALSLDPGSAESHFGRAMVRLVTGDWSAGWADYEFRPMKPADPSLAPRWRGEDPAGRAILIYADQGAGDTVQFIRYLPLLAARDARIVLSVPEDMRALIATLPGIETLTAPLLPPTDWSLPLSSLPLLFGTTLDTIPSAIPYLAAPPEKDSAWQQRLTPSPLLTVALVWAGNPQHPNDHNRSLRFAAIAPLLSLSGIRFLLLQKGPAADQARGCEKRVAAGSAILALGPALADFADTAAVLSQADLTISVDTSLCHLAGALGKPVWTLLPFSADWRWLTEREDSPWYPTMRLYRQPRYGAWSDVVSRVRQDLASLVQSRSAESGIGAAALAQSRAALQDSER